MNSFQHRSLVLCDFDGTITTDDVTDSLLNKFAKGDWMDIGKKYDNDKISHFEMNSRFAKTIRCTPEEMQQFLKSRKWVRNGFYNFIKRYQSKKILVCIVSSGWDVYIQNILSDLKLNKVNKIDDLKKLSNIIDGIPVICNKISHNSKGEWELDTIWESCSCEISSPCKGKILDILVNKFELISVIGNSSTDMCMIKKANLVYSTGSLTKLCKDNNINCKHFDSFDELI